MHDTPSSPPGPDISQIHDRPLAEAPFPRGDGTGFRVYLTPEVHKELWTHATEDTSVEICGVLVGRWARDQDGAYVEVTDSIRGEAARNKFAEVTFTHETWARINGEMDKKFTDRDIVGWYHTHPDFGIFLSDRDRFIQEHFFSGAGQVALVVDPIRRTEGVFVWRSGKPSMAPHYWVGDRVVVGTAAGEETARAPSNLRSEPSPPRPAEAPGAESSRPFLTQSLAYLALFLLGFLISGLRSSWEQVRLAEGVVAHYGIWQGLRPGLHEELSVVRDRLEKLSQRTAALAADQKQRAPATKDKKADAELARQWNGLQADLSILANHVDKLDERYRLSPGESAAIEKMVIEKLRAVDDPRAPAPVPKASRSTKTAVDKTRNAAPEARPQTPPAARPSSPPAQGSRQ